MCGTKTVYPKKVLRMPTSTRERRVGMGTATDHEVPSMRKGWNDPYVETGSI